MGIVAARQDRWQRRRRSVRTAWTAACVPPGKYQWGIRLSQYNTNTVIFPEVLNVEPGKLLRPQSPGALTFVPSSWSGVPFYLNVLDAKSGRVVQGISSGAALTSLLPPGEYRVNITPFQYNSMDVTLLESVKVQSGQSVKVLLNTGLDVQPAKTGRPEPPPYRFAFTREGDEKPTQSIIGANWGPALLPAGRYHVTLSRNQYGSRDIVWPTLVQVAPGELAKLSINSGIHLTEMTKEQAKSLSFQILSLPAPASATTQAATAPAPPPATPTVVQTGNASVAAQTQWLPPGTYCVQIQDNVGAWQTAADNVQVPAGRVVDVKITGPASGAAQRRSRDPEELVNMDSAAICPNCKNQGFGSWFGAHLAQPMCELLVDTKRHTYLGQCPVCRRLWASHAHQPQMSYEINPNEIRIWFPDVSDSELHDLLAEISREIAK